MIVLAAVQPCSRAPWPVGVWMLIMLVAAAARLRSTRSLPRARPLTMGRRSRAARNRVLTPRDFGLEDIPKSAQRQGCRT